MSMADAANDDPLVAGILALAEAEFGDRLDDAARARVRKQAEAIAANSRELSAVPLANGQEPEFVFTARREG